MDQLRRIMASINKQLKELTVSGKVALLSVGIVLLLSLALVALLTNKPNAVELFPGMAAADQAKAKAYLDGVGVKTTMQDGGKLMVPADQAAHAKAMLAESGTLPSDKSQMFETLLSKASWTNSRQQNEELYKRALQSELASTIENFHGVKSATVLIDIPEVAGLGAAVRKPTASATIFTSTGEPMPQSMVDAVASFIAGSRSGLDVSRVRIIDGTSHQQRRARGEEDALSNTYLEQAARVEKDTREKVLDLLQYIPGVIVAVTAQVDVTKVTSQVQNYLPDGKGTVSLDRKRMETTNSTSEASSAAEPGLGSNITADINRGGGALGSRTEQTESTVESENHVGSKTDTIVDPKGHPTMVAVSVNVPRGFVASLIKTTPPAGGAAPAAPTDTEIDTEFTKVKDVIVNSIKPQVRAMTALANGSSDAKALEALVSSSIGVSLIPLDLPAPSGSPQPSGLLGTLAAGGGGGAFGLNSGLVDKAVLGGLAVVAMGMMIMMMRKAGRKVEIPTAEELVGLPPALEAQADVIGEADEGDMAMPGIEVGEDEMQSQKVLEQVADLVTKSPDSAAKLIGRWISVED
jgi:flagellar biosynthesis/type III secretory pathway M-ring protein FliF/YscJ